MAQYPMKPFPRPSYYAPAAAHLDTLERDAERPSFSAVVPLIAVSSQNGSIAFFRTDTSEKVYSCLSPTGGCCLSPCYYHGRVLLAAGGHDSGVRVSQYGVQAGSGDINLVDFYPYRMVLPGRLSGHTDDVRSLLDLPDSGSREDCGLLASGSKDKTVRVWRKDERTEVACLIGHDACVWELCSFPAKNWLVSGSYGLDTGGVIRAWDLETKICVGMRDAHVHAEGSESSFVLASLATQRQPTILHPPAAAAASSTPTPQQHPLCVLVGSSSALKLVSVAGGFQPVVTFGSQDIGIGKGRGVKSLLPHPSRVNLFFTGHPNGEISMWDVRKSDRCVKKAGAMCFPVGHMAPVDENRFACCSAHDVRLLTTEGLVDVFEEENKKVPDAVAHQPMRTGFLNVGLCCVPCVCISMPIPIPVTSEIQVSDIPLTKKLYDERKVQFAAKRDERRQLMSVKKFESFLRAHWLYTQAYGLIAFAHLHPFVVIKGVIPEYREEDHLKDIVQVIIMLRRIAECCYYLGHLDEGVSFAEKAIEVCGERRRCKSFLGFTTLAKIYVEKKEYDKAERMIQNAKAVRSRCRFVHEALRLLQAGRREIPLDDGPGFLAGEEEERMRKAGERRLQIELLVPPTLK